MSLTTSTCFCLLFACIGAFAATGEKPSPVHYRSSTAPARRDPNKSAPIANAAEGSRNRLRDLSAAPGPQRGDRQQAKMVDGFQAGIACFYGVKQTDSGVGNQETNDQELRAAHASLAFGSQVLVTNAANGRSIKVTITDRIAPDAERIISVSRRAAEQLGFVSAGTATVKLQLLHESSRL